MPLSDSSLREVLGPNVLWEHLRCSICCTSAHSVVPHSNYEWCSILSCVDLSHSNWFVCRECNNLTAAITTNDKLLRHARNNHSPHNKRQKTSVALLPTVATTHVATSEKSARPLPILPGFSRQPSTNYFQFQRQNLGPALLVARSQFHQDDLAGDICADEVQFHLRLSQFMSSLSNSDCESLVELLRLHQKTWHTRSAKSDSTAQLSETRIPLDYADCRRLYLEGKYAVLPNLPHPEVKVVGNHAMITISDCIADLLAHGVPLDFLQHDPDGPGMKGTVRTLSESYRAKKIAARAHELHPGSPVSAIYLIEWSDDCEPNSSSKANRGSIWLKTMTIAPHPDCDPSLYTYPIAVGPKGVSHEEVELQLKDDYLSLSGKSPSLFYSSRDNRTLNVHAEILVSLMDQPE